MISSHEQAQAVRNQLEHLLAGPALSGAPRLSSLLRYLVEETLAGRGDQLKEYTVATAVLGRGSAFDPRLDSIVRVEASKLRARLSAYYKGAGARDAIVIEVPRGSYVPRFSAGTRENDVVGRKGSIAVLPLVNLGPESDAEYLADGLTEEIIDRLGTITEMRVVARTSAFQFRGKVGDIQQIGRALNAEYLLEGSIRRSENRLRVNARLIEAATGYRVWSHAYDGTTEDIFGIQTKIADAIGAAFGGRRRPAAEGTAAGELGAEAYHLYLRGRFHRNQWTLGGLEKSIEYFERALALEPESAQILGALSEVQTMRPILGDIPAAPNMGGRGRPLSLR